MASFDLRRALVLALLSACGAPPDPAPSEDDTGGDAPGPDTDEPVGDTTDPGDDTADTTDTGCELPTAFVDATALTVDGDPAAAGFDAADEQDVFQFELAGTDPTWLRVFVASTPASDTAVTLFDACGVALAQNDATFLNREGNLYTRLTEAGTYYVQVEEGATFRGSGDSAAPFSYALAAVTIDGTVAGENLSTGDNDGNDTAQNVTFARRSLDAASWPDARLISEQIERRDVDHAVILGTYEGDPDTDYFTWARIGGDARLSGFSLLSAPGGTSGTGSTASNRVYYYAPGRPGDATVDEGEIRTVSPFPNDYFLQISDTSGGGVGFYVVELLRVDDFF